MKVPNLRFQVHEGEFAIARLDPDAPEPSWIDRGNFYTVTRTRGELSIIASAPCVPPSAQHERGWSLIETIGPFDFTAVGIAAAITASLARRGIALLLISTFQTDYVLLKRENLERAIAALREDGHEVRRGVSD